MSFDRIPETKRAAVEAVCSAAFGGAPIEKLTPLSGGASGASVFRAQARGQYFLLRVEGIPSPLRNPHQYQAMRIAADAGIAPPILHLDEANGIIVTDFIAAQPLATFPGGTDALLHALGTLARRVQATPLFPHFVEYPDIVARLAAHIVRTGLFAPGLLDPHLDRLEQVSQALRAAAEPPVSSHNDPNARNILFDGARLWLIDWESAYRNDPLVDVAILLEGFANTSAREDQLLAAWLGAPPTAGLRERLALVRSLTRLYYSGVLLSASAVAGRDRPDADLTVPTLDQFRDAQRTGRLPRGAPETIHIAGKMYLAAFLDGRAVPPIDSV